MRIYATWFIAAIALLAASGAQAATGRGNDIVLQILRLLAPGI